MPTTTRREYTPMRSAGRKAQSNERHRRKLEEQRDNAMQDWLVAAKAWVDLGSETANPEATRVARESLARRMDKAASSFDMAKAALGERDFGPV